TGKRVAIIGGGPAGLSAAYFLLRYGHGCTVFEQRERAGGRLHEEVGEQLPVEELTAEISLIERQGARLELNQVVERLPAEFDAVLIATGRQGADSGELLGLPLAAGRLPVDGKTHATSAEGVFAAGDVAREHKDVVKAAADGKAAANCIDQYLRGAEVSGPPKLKSLRISPPRGEELTEMLAGASDAARVEPAEGIAGGLTEEEAEAEAQRCLHCDCRSLERCKLRRYAEEYGADGGRYRGVRREARCVLEHPDILFEPGKCILCGLCIQVAARAGEPVGLTLNGRGFDTRVVAPFDESLAAALRVAGKRCVEVCPAGALVWRVED
ncbi:MAG: FAD-dependent oxidoreductase, partial [Planctomycetota bacterium]